MAKASGSIPLSQLQRDPSTAVKRVRRSKRPLFVTQRGKATAVLLSIDVFEKSAQEREILTLLVRGEREIAAGKGYDLDDVLAEADALLAET